MKLKNISVQAKTPLETMNHLGISRAKANGAVHPLLHVIYFFSTAVV